MSKTPNRTRWWDRLERGDLTWPVAVALGVLLLAFVMLAREVMTGATRSFDESILLALRDPANLARPIGPEWIEGSILDLTALGGSTILWTIVAAVIGFLLVQTRYRTAVIVLTATASGELLTSLLKRAFNRPRPTVVPHLRAVYSTSFPSGHAMESTIVYLTLAAILVRVSCDRSTKIYILVVAMLLSALAGISRVYVGVHYPSDVIGGWIAGLFWATIWWLAARQFDGTTHIRAERTKSA
jgi:undecaprenyl-diphosphatase